MAPAIPPDQYLAGQSFRIFDEGQHLSKDKHALAEDTEDQALKELSQSQSSNLWPPAVELKRFARSQESNPGKIQSNRRTTRPKRLQVDAETFEPLGPVPEETSDLAELEDTGFASPAAATNDAKAMPIKLNKEQSLVASSSNSALEGQVEKHLAGQFDWILAYPAEASSSTAKGSQQEQLPGCSSGKTFYGCNLLPSKRRLPSQFQVDDLATNTYTILATPLNKDSYASLNMNGPKGLDVTCLPPPPYPGPPLKVPDVVTMVEQALSPSLTNVSEKSGSLVDGSSRTGSFSAPRIEDSLEELDKLEDELDAIHQVTNPCRLGPTKEKSTHPATCPEFQPSTATPTTSSNRIMAGYSATVRVKSSDKANTSLRRSASLTFHEKKHTPQQQESSGRRDITRDQSATNHLSTPKHPVRSAKPPTIPKFELPGDAVARRLKEQREARLAQQAEAQKAQTAPPPKPRANKLLPKPTFELPGEAISRRKREEREAKLRAEEEEQQKRREFKARPVRHSIGPPHPPRGTLASQARRNRASPEVNGDDKSREGMQAKRMSMGFIHSDASSTMSHSPGVRGRMSMMMTTSNTSRATSTSMDSVSGKRSSVSLEDLAAQRQRGKEIFARENKFTQDKGKEKREREMAAKTAREQAAERSRIASREWADRKRRKELAMKQASKGE